MVSGTKFLLLIVIAVVVAGVDIAGIREFGISQKLEQVGFDVDAVRRVLGIEWTLGEWSKCSKTCGKEDQVRSFRCATGECKKPRPEDKTRPCAIPMCDWVAGPWTPCMKTCGPESKSRDYVCPAGDGECDLSAKPAKQEADCGNRDCSWEPGPWSPCTKDCGPESKTREFRCPKGKQCRGSPPPPDTRDCENPKCEWNVGPWSDCISGNDCQSPDDPVEKKTRTVTCRGEKETDCTDPKPATEENCLLPCYTAGPWKPACPTTCDAPTTQTREVSCPSGECGGRYPEVERDTCPKYSCWVPDDGTRALDEDTLRACNALETKTGQSCWRPSVSKAQRTKTCPNHCVPFVGGKKLTPFLTTKARCGGKKCHEKDPGKSDAAQRTECSPTRTCWAVGEWEPTNRDEPPCNQRISGVTEGMRARKVTCPSGFGCTTKKPEAHRIFPYEYDCYKGDDDSGKPYEWGDCRTKLPDKRGKHLKCGKGLFVQKRNIPAPPKGNDPCGPLNESACKSKRTSCRWDSLTKTCDNRTTSYRYRNRTFYDMKPKTEKACNGRECRWNYGQMSPCRTATNYPAICGRGTAKQDVACNGGEEAKYACQAASPLPKKCNLNYGKQCQVDCDMGECPYTASHGSEMRVVLTPTTSKAVRDFAAAQSAKVKNLVFRTFGMTMGGIKKLGDFGFNKGGRQPDDMVPRNLWCGFNAKPDHLRKKDDPIVIDGKPSHVQDKTSEEIVPGIRTSRFTHRSGESVAFTPVRRENWKDFAADYDQWILPYVGDPTKSRTACGDRLQTYMERRTATPGPVKVTPAKKRCGDVQMPGSCP